MAMLLTEYAEDKNFTLDKVLKMVIVHDTSDLVIIFPIILCYIVHFNSVMFKMQHITLQYLQRTLSCFGFVLHNLLVTASRFIKRRVDSKK